MKTQHSMLAQIHEAERTGTIPTWPDRFEGQLQLTVEYAKVMRVIEERQMEGHYKAVVRYAKGLLRAQQKRDNLLLDYLRDATRYVAPLKLTERGLFN
jgi:hypothetical protein